MKNPEFVSDFFVHSMRHAYEVKEIKVVFHATKIFAVICIGLRLCMNHLMNAAKRNASSYPAGWLGSRVVSVLDTGAEGPGFKSQSRRCRVTVLGKLFTPVVPLFTKQKNW